MTVEYTDPDGVTDTRVTDTPATGQTVSGYGSAVPTQHMIRYAGTWRRVYAMVYGNSGTPYVKVRGRDVVLDAATQQRLAQD
jgi:hypothetical protein